MCVATACTNVLPFSGVEKVTWTALLPCGASAMGMREGFMVAALVVRGLHCVRDCGVGFIETVSGICFKSKAACDEPVCSRAHAVRDVSGAGEHGLIEPRVVASLTAVVFLDMALRVLSRPIEPGSKQGT